MTTRKQKRNQKGGQPLSYTNPNYSEPSALAGSPILNSAGTVARPEIPQKGGVQRVYTDVGQWVPWTQSGAPLIIQPQSGGQPLSYTNTNYREVSALPGAPLLESYGTVARPEIPQRGGFTPSIMTNLVGNAAYLTPLAMTAAYRLLSNKQTRKQRGGNGENWETYKQQAKIALDGVARGRANAKWINKLAKLLKEKKNAAEVLADFAREKGVEGKGVGRPRFATKLNEWEYNQRIAKKELAKYGEPTAVEVTHLAALKTGRKGKAGDADQYLEEFKRRQAEKKTAAEVAAREQEEKRIQKQIQDAERAAAKAAPKPKVEKPKVPKLPKPKLTFNERPWEEIRREAKGELVAMKKVIKRGNVMKYASMKRLKNTERQQKFLEEFRARPDVLVEAPRESSPEPESESNEEFRLNRLPQEKRKRRTVKKGRAEWESYQSGAKRMLERIGPATIAEISVLAKMMKHGENIRPFLNEFEGRVKHTEAREAELERERNSKPPSPKPVVAVVADPTPKPVAKPAEELPPPPPPVAKPAVELPPPAAAKPIQQGEFARFRARMAELAKKYPPPK